jgi:predicted dehydrogenase
MKQVQIGIIGTGWCGGIRAETCSASPYVRALHLAEIKPERLQEVAAKTRPATATADYQTLLGNSSIDAIFISATPETTHFPMAKQSLLAGKHVFLEKPIALELSEADQLISLAHEKGLLFTVGYSQADQSGSPERIAVYRRVLAAL